MLLPTAALVTEAEVDQLVWAAKHGGAHPALLAKLRSLVQRDRVLTFQRIAEGQYLVGREPNTFLFEAKWDLPVRLIHEAVSAPNRYVVDTSLLIGEETQLLLRPERVRQILERCRLRLERSSGELAMALGGRLKRRLDKDRRIVLLAYVPDERSPTIRTAAVGEVSGI